MAQIRPAGLSDEDTDSEDYGFFEKPVRRHYVPQQQSSKKKIEVDLQDAIIHGNIPEVQKIIKTSLSSNVNIRLDSGWTPLMHACFHAQDEIVKMLLEMGADPNLHADSMTPVMSACSNTNAQTDAIYNIISLLIHKGCILNIGDKYGHTPLMRAISSGKIYIVKLLLDHKVNIEMRDRQGWTAVFWAAHHNQPEILESLISYGARVDEVDASGRTPFDIASSHDHQPVMDILYEHTKKDDELSSKKMCFVNTLGSWHDYYPGVKTEGMPSYSNEIPSLLYGMNCEQLTQIIMDTKMDLRTFLLLQEEDMIKLGINLPYERQRLKLGLRNFHMKSWKLSSVSGLYARNVENYSVLDCLTTLGNHLQQMYILEASLQYNLREFRKVSDQLKFEPPDSPVILKLNNAYKKMFTNINSIRTEIRIMKSVLTKISVNNPQPADYIKNRTTSELLMNYVPDLVAVFSLGLVVYQIQGFIADFLKK